MVWFNFVVEAYHPTPCSKRLFARQLTVESWAVLLAIARVSLCVALPVAFPNPTSIVNVENFNRCGRKGNDEGAWVDWWWGGQLSLGAGNIRHFLPPR